MIEPLAHIGAMAPYELANLMGPNDKRIISMAQNESIRPPSPRVAEAVKRALSQAHLYPDPDWLELRESIAGVYGIAAEHILCGAGSMELIACLCQTFLDDRASAVTTQFAYAFFQTAAQLKNAKVVIATESDYTISIDTILDRCEKNTRMVFVANPGNPTGTCISNGEIRRLRKELPEEILLIVDEAYGEFVLNEDGGLFDLCELGNTVIIRTFSKAYGLAGMRIGWGVFPAAVAKEIRKVLNPNNISLVGQVAALAAVRDQTYMQRTCLETISLRERFRNNLNLIDLQTPVSKTNFLLLPFSSRKDANDANQFLISQGIIMRQMGGYGLPNCLRATIVDDEELTFVESMMEKWVDQRNGSNG